MGQPGIQWDVLAGGKYSRAAKDFRIAVFFCFFPTSTHRLVEREFFSQILTTSKKNATLWLQRIQHILTLAAALSLSLIYELKVTYTFMEYVVENNNPTSKQY